MSSFIRMRRPTTKQCFLNWVNGSRPRFVNRSRHISKNNKRITSSNAPSISIHYLINIHQFYELHLQQPPLSLFRIVLLNDKNIIVSLSHFMLNLYSLWYKFRNHCNKASVTYIAFVYSKLKTLMFCTKYSVCRSLVCSCDSTVAYSHTLPLIIQ